MTQDSRLRQQLDSPSVPDDLESKIIMNWKQQLVRPSGSRARHRLALAASIVLLVGIAALVTSGFYKNPAVVESALADIDKDMRQNIGLSISVESLKGLRQVNLPPVSMSLKMTKFCMLDGSNTTHLQVAGEKQGSVHLFIYEGDFSIRFWQRERGEINAMPWQIIKPRAGLSVLVLHTPDMNPDSVDKLLKTMFYV